MSSGTKNSVGVGVGKRIERIRELRGMKQETLASILGVSQQTISRIEKSDTIDDEKLDQVANALGVSSEALKNFDVESAINNIGNTFNEGSLLINYNFNPVEKIVELYEALLQSEREKIALLEKFAEKTTTQKK